jgi:hypothetical protein
VTTQPKFDDPAELEPYYRALLDGDVLPDEPCPGLFRLPARMTNSTGNTGNKPPISWPVVIWRDVFTKKLMVRFGKREDADLIEGSDRYLQFVDGGWRGILPVSEEEYDRRLETGSWSNESVAVTRSNLAPPDDSYEGLRDAIENLAREAQDLIGRGVARNKHDADQAADVANKLGQLQKRADSARLEQKRPYMEQAKAVDDLWSPLVSLAGIFAKLKALVITPFLQQAKRAAEEARFQAQLTGTPEDKLPATKITAGARGRPVALRTIKHAKITNYDALLEALKDHGDVQIAVQKAANASARAGITLPGMEIVETEAAA